MESIIGQWMLDVLQPSFDKHQFGTVKGNADALLQHLQLLKGSDLLGLKFLDVETVSRHLARMKKMQSTRC